MLPIEPVVQFPTQNIFLMLAIAMDMAGRQSDLKSAKKIFYTQTLREPSWGEEHYILEELKRRRAIR